MFEDYVEDAYSLAISARGETDERVAKRYYRAAIFYAVSSIEAFLNFVGETLENGGKVPEYEIAFLKDRKFGIAGDSFEMLSQMEFHKIEEKLRFLIKKHAKNYDLGSEPSWADFIAFKKFRDELVHPRKMEDEIGISEYDEILRVGLGSTIEIMDTLCKGLFDKGLRKKIVEMAL
jgi:hypothetical protein